MKEVNPGWDQEPSRAAAPQKPPGLDPLVEKLGSYVHPSTGTQHSQNK